MCGTMRSDGACQSRRDGVKVNAGGESTPNLATHAGMYAYYLNDGHHLEADRVAARKVIEKLPMVPLIARANRAFLGRAVEYLADHNIRQFLDIGSGYPTGDNVHTIAQRKASDARVLYVDVDPVVVMDSNQMLSGNDLAMAVSGDLRDPDDLLDRVENSPDLNAIIDLREPVALILVAVLHFVTDDAVAYRAVERLVERLVPGSYLVVCHAAVEGYPPDGQFEAAREVYARSTQAAAGLRSWEQIRSFFGDLALVEPGLVWMPQWRPTGAALFSDEPHLSGSFAGVAVKR